eukprot:CAMPEP_0194508290 /NCGR_PEP_ID=MMETSP0253-20130528/38366_1 /TAXON_ID=2966 /ORGANISM="Noctiluca scintillans" /LENGTH=157 /DNA_ID=CAMNT_0039351303 /DNA_START=53 /DNA_END=523 /DNA_ORIENTATION=-
MAEVEVMCAVIMMVFMCVTLGVVLYFVADFRGVFCAGRDDDEHRASQGLLEHVQRYQKRAGVQELKQQQKNRSYGGTCKQTWADSLAPASSLLMQLGVPLPETEQECCNDTKQSMIMAHEAQFVCVVLRRFSVKSLTDVSVRLNGQREVEDSGLACG